MDQCLQRTATALFNLLMYETLMIMMMIVMVVVVVVAAAAVTTTMILCFQGMTENSNDDTIDTDLMPTGWPHCAPPSLHKSEFCCRSSSPSNRQRQQLQLLHSHVKSHCCRRLFYTAACASCHHAAVRECWRAFCTRWFASNEI
jgi:hypothetical protein